MKRFMSMFAACLLVVTLACAQSGSLPEKAEAVSPLLEGMQVPSAMISSIAGKMVDIREVISAKPAILVFYRGGWCPYCNKHLSELAGIEKDLKALGYQVIAVSPDTPGNLRATMGKNKTGYQLYSDSKGMLIRAMGIAYQVPANYAGIIREASGGENTTLLPVPAVFITGKTGQVLFSYVNPDFRQRMSGKLLLAAAAALKK